MTTLMDLMTALLPLLYGLTAANYAVYFVRRDPFAERLCTPSLTVTLAFHLVFFVSRGLLLGRMPLANLPEVLSGIALAVGGVYLYVERMQDARSTGVFLIGMATLLQLFASALLPHTPELEAPLLQQTSLWALHTAAVVLGYSAFAVGAVYGLMFVLLYRVLKQKHFGLLFDRLPPLDVLARMGMGAALLGLAFLTVVIGLGVLMSARLVPNFWTDPKFISALLVWAIYAFAAIAYFLLGWRGARAVTLSLLGFAVAVLTMVGSTYLWRSFHSFSA